MLTSLVVVLNSGPEPADPPGWLSPSVAFDGWVGSVIGAITAAGIALATVWITLRFERKRVQEAADRELAHRRLERLAEVTVALQSYEAIPATAESLNGWRTDIQAAISRWVPYAAPDETGFVDEVRWGCHQVIGAAWQLMHGTAPRIMPAEGVGTLVSAARDWPAATPERRKEIVGLLRTTFPRVGQLWPVNIR